MRRSPLFWPKTHNWTRFRRYEIRDGVIRPVRGAALERYDPWRQYRDLSFQGLKERPPYEALFKAVQELTSGRRSKGEKLICEWCSQYGLLGILLQDVTRVDLAWRWERVNKADPQVLEPVQISYRRIGGSWQRFPFCADDMRRKPTASIQPGKPCKVIDRRPGGARVFYVDSPTGFDSSIGERWRQFFPDVSEAEEVTFPYPEPLTDEFWRAYAEPLPVFLEAAQRLSLIHYRLTRQQLPGRMSRQATANYRHAARDLNAILSATSPVVVVTLGKEKPSQEWASGSLIATLGLMLRHDLSIRTRTLTCPCGTPFQTDAWQGRYCSPRCRMRILKRRQRDKQRRNQAGHRSS